MKIVNIAFAFFVFSLMVSVVNSTFPPMLPEANMSNATAVFERSENATLTVKAPSTIEYMDPLTQFFSWFTKFLTILAYTTVHLGGYIQTIIPVIPDSFAYAISVAVDLVYFLGVFQFIVNRSFRGYK